ncbi:hypothetical protein E9097_24990 (plasmid) [Escherichia coli]|nr:hypothetical protein [Escherichia coli]PWR57008.1 hypothetical protein AJ318_11270 [Escherichia coli]QCD71976.1 hypothetical protein E9097_24990 [Escherichia coli]TJQ15187.1 hypothetical protein C9Z67_24890 [Escherichia coli]
MKPASAQKNSTTHKNSLIICLPVSHAPPVFHAKHVSQTGNSACPHFTARDFSIRLQPFMS